MISESHISSLIVHTLPDKTVDIGLTLKAMDNVDVFNQIASIGKIIAVIEANSMKATSKLIDRLSQLEGVINVAMVYHHVEPIHSLDEEFA